MVYHFLHLSFSIEKYAFTVYKRTYGKKEEKVDGSIPEKKSRENRFRNCFTGPIHIVIAQIITITTVGGPQKHNVLHRMYDPGLRHDAVVKN